MSQYQTYECSSIEEYWRKREDYEDAQHKAAMLRAKGFIVNVHVDYPLPPANYPFPVVVEIK